MDIYLISRAPMVTGYDEVEEFVVIAPSPSRARELAASQAADEGSAIWLTSCAALEKIGTAATSADERIVVRNFIPG